jgi:hypothetical protein
MSGYRLHFWELNIQITELSAFPADEKATCPLDLDQ